MMLTETHYHAPEMCAQAGSVTAASLTSSVATSSANPFVNVSTTSVDKSTKASVSSVMGKTTSGLAQSSAKDNNVSNSYNCDAGGNHCSHDTTDRLLYSGFLEKRTSSVQAPHRRHEGTEILLFELVLITIPEEQSATSKLRAGRQDCLLRYFEISQAASDCSHDQCKTNYGTSSPPDGRWLERFRGEVVLTKATHVASATSDPVCGLRVFFPCGRALKMKAPTGAAAETWKSALRQGIFAARAYSDDAALVAIQSAPRLPKLDAFLPELDSLLPKLDASPHHEIHDPSPLFHHHHHCSDSGLGGAQSYSVSVDKRLSQNGCNSNSSSHQEAGSSGCSSAEMHGSLSCVEHGSSSSNPAAPRIEPKVARSLPSPPSGDGPALRRRRTTSGASSVVATTTAAGAATATTTVMSNDLDGNDKSSSTTVVRASSCHAPPSRPSLRRACKAESLEEPTLLPSSYPAAAATATTTAKVSTGSAAAVEALKLQERVTRGFEAWSSFAAVRVVCPGTREMFEVPPRYVLSGRLGSGAYGVVALAKDSACDNKPVAIKKVREAFRDAVDARRILRELRLMRVLRHPCLLSLDTCFGGYDRKQEQENSSHTNHKSCGSNTNGAVLDEPMRMMSLDNNDMMQRNSLRGPLNDVYLVTPALDTDLHTVVFDRRVRLSNEQSAWIAYQCIAGVAHLHSRGVAHRDLKLANILVDLAECSIRICDFGLSRVLKEAKPSRRDGSNNGGNDASGFDDDTFEEVNIEEGDGDEDNDDEDGTSHTLYVVTRWYRAPELLLGYAGYGTAIDCWALGIVVGELLGRKPLLSGRNLRDQLERVLRLVGPLDIAHDDQVPSNENQTNADAFKSNGSALGNSSSEGSIGNSSSGSSGGSSGGSGGNTDDGDSTDGCDDDMAYDDDEDGKEAEKCYDPLWFVPSPRARQFVRSFYANNRAQSRRSVTSPAAARRPAASSTAAATSRIAVSPDDNTTARNPPQTSAPSRSVRSEIAARRTGHSVTPNALNDDTCDSRHSHSHASTLTTSSHRDNEVSRYHHHHSDNSSVGTGARRFTRTSALVTPPTASTAVRTTAVLTATGADSAIAAAVEAASAAQQEEGSRMAARFLWPGIWALLPSHMPPLAVDLMGQLLMFDPKKRLKAHEALAHSWLESVRERGSYEDGLELGSTLQEDVLGTSHDRSHRWCRGSGNHANQGGINGSCSNSTNRVYTADIEALPVTSDAMRSAMQSEFDLFHTTQPRERAEEQ